jgi:hypothetical protein
MNASLVIETWNLQSENADVEPGLIELLGRLHHQPCFADLAEVVVTHTALVPGAQARLERAAGRPLHLLQVPPATHYYVHKNLGFDATTAPIVAFIDGDCRPTPGWLHHLLAPLLSGHARVVAGRTLYPPGPASLAGTAMDFPLVPSPHTRGAVLNFFANNVAFARDVFARHRYIVQPGAHKGACQVLALDLSRARITIRLAEQAVLHHAWPDSLTAHLRTRLLRGADARSLCPHLLRAHAPRLATPLSYLGPLPALALIATRALTAGTAIALHPRSWLGGAAAITTATVIDSLGALASARVHRRLAA